MNILNILILVFIGGGFGSISRFGVGMLSSSVWPNFKFPLGTLIANFLACLVLGIVLYLIKDKALSNEWIKYLIVIGFCGGFSTFSTFSLDTVRLVQDGFLLFAVLNILVSLALGFGVLWLIAK